MSGISFSLGGFFDWEEHQVRFEPPSIDTGLQRDDDQKHDECRTMSGTWAWSQERGEYSLFADMQYLIHRNKIEY